MRDTDFQLAICEAITVLESEIAVARAIRVDTPSVTGWSVGVNMPHPLLRSAIVAALCEAMRVKVKEDAWRLELRSCNGTEDYMEVDALAGDRVTVTCFADYGDAFVSLDRASAEKLHAVLGAWLERDDG